MAFGDIGVTFAWQAWHLVTWTSLLCGKRGAQIRQGWVWWRAWSPVTPCAACGGIDDVFVWQARRDAGLALVARLVASDATVFLCGKRGLWCH